MIALFPKPRVLTPQIERLPRSVWMTIAAGFRADGGVVLCADTQETIPDYLKTQTSKIALFEKNEEFRIAMTGAGGSDMIDMIYQTIIGKFMENRAYDYATVEQTIRDVVYETETKHVLPYPREERPSFHLVIALQVKGERVRLLKTVDTTVRHEDNFTCAGDVALAYYAAGRLDFSQMPVCFARSYAIYMLQQVKAYSPTCGKQTEVLVLYDDWDIENLSDEFIQTEEFHIARINALTRHLLANSFAHRAQSESLQEDLEHLKRHIEEYREWEMSQSDEHCKLRNELFTKEKMIRVGQHGLREGYTARQKRVAG